MPFRTLVWCEPDQIDFARDVAREADLEFVAGGAMLPDDSATVTETLGVDRVDDIRQAILRDDVDLMWLASADRLDAAERRLIREVGRVAVTTMPRPGAIADVVADPIETSTASFVPRMSRASGFRDVFDAAGTFGEIECLSVISRCRSVEGTLFARLFDAIDLVASLFGEAESVRATLAGGRVPETLAGLHGHMTVDLRFGDGRGAAITASDRGGEWFREMTALGAGGCLRADDDGLDWTGHDGETIEAKRRAERTGAALATAAQITRILGERTSADPPADAAQLLAVCEAARLSARTGQAESPTRLLEVLSRT